MAWCLISHLQYDLAVFLVADELDQVEAVFASGQIDDLLLVHVPAYEAIFGLNGLGVIILMGLHADLHISSKVDHDDFHSIVVPQVVVIGFVRLQQDVEGLCDVHVEEFVFAARVRDAEFCFLVGQHSYAKQIMNCDTCSPP